MNEPSIREWFNQFGPLNQVIVDTSWGKAVLVYSDYESASKAWNDPRPVFSNRFVKIWWKKTDRTTTAEEKLSGGIVDAVELEVAREAAAKAQKEHEEKQRKKEELERKKEELERQRVELVERQKAERERLMEKIRKAEEKAKEKIRGVVHSATPTATDSQTSMGEEKENPTHESQVTNGSGSDRTAHLQKMVTDLKNQVRSL